MLLTLNLSALKSSGIYTYEYDHSEEITIDSQLTRLVVGFSRKGPINAPVYLSNKKSAREIFGDVDKQLEKRGSFFHRAIYTCLDQGPIFALNIVPIKNVDTAEQKADRTNYFSYSLSPSEENGKDTNELYCSYFNKERFWSIDTDYLLANVNASNSVNKGKLLNFTFLGQTPVSILVRKSKPLSQFKLTATEWYRGRDNVPTYIYPDDHVSDYFIDVIIVQGDWTNYEKLSIDPIYSEYFTNKGIRKDKLSDFLNLSYIKSYGTFTGTIIPDFRDSEGTLYSIDTILNNSLESTLGICCAIDKEALEEFDVMNQDSDVSKVDLIGHSFANSTDIVGTDDPNVINGMPNSINFLSYKFGVNDDYQINNRNSIVEDRLTTNFRKLADNDFCQFDVNGDNGVFSVKLGGTNGYFNNALFIRKPDENDNEEYDYLPYYEYLKANLVIGSVLTNGNINYKITNKFENTFNGHRIGAVSGVASYADKDITGLVLYLSNEDIKKQSASYNTDGNFITVSKRSNFDNNIVLTVPVAGQPNYSDDTFDINTEFTLTLPIAVDSTLVPNASFANKLVLLTNNTTETPNSYCYGTITSYTAATQTDPAFIDVKLKPSMNPNSLLFDELTNATNTYVTDDTDPENITHTYTGSKSNFKVSENNLQLFTPCSTDGACDIDGLTAVDIDNVNIYGNIGTTKLETKYSINTGVYTREYQYIRAYEGSDLANAIENNLIQTGDYLNINNETSNGIDANDYFVKIVENNDENGFFVYDLIFYTKYIPAYNTVGDIISINFTDGDRVSGDTLAQALEDNGYLTAWTASETVTLDNTIDPSQDVVGDLNPLQFFDSGISNIGQVRKYFNKIPVLNVSEDGKIVTIENRYNTDVLLDDFIVSKQKTEETGVFQYRLVRIVKKIKNPTDERNIDIYLAEPAYGRAIGSETYIFRFTSIDDYAQTYTMQYYKGFKMTEWHLPGGQEKLVRIFSMLDPTNTNLMNVLKEKELIGFRYIVDTFDGGIQSMNYPKNFLTKLAMERGKCLAIMNFPSFKSFYNSTDPRFTDLPTDEDPKPILNTAYIAAGGNLELNPSYTFGLPDETNGSKYAGYFGPFLMVRENGRNFAVPPAADVSNLFIAKHKSGNPFAIVAGTKRGTISNSIQTGLEYDMIKTDRDNLEPIGLNPIIKKTGYGYLIYGNQLAYQRTKSAYNNLHVRDVLITIEENIESILENYVFEKNTANVRLEIKNLIDKYLSGVQNLDGIYSYSTQIDSQNNTDEVINANTLVVDIAVEPTRGIHKIVNRIHVYGSGGIAASGFSVSNVIL